VRRMVLAIVSLFLLVAAIIFGYSVLNACLDAPRTIEDLGPVYCLAISRDGKRVVSGHQDSRARVWEVDSGELIAEFGRQQPAVVSAFFSPDGNHIAFAHADEFVRIWDLRLGQETKTFRGHTGTVRTIAYMPNGKQILSAGADKIIRLWDIASASQARWFVGHGADVNAVAAFADGHKIISASGDYWGGRVNESSVRVWNADTGKEIKKFEGEFAPMSHVVVSPDDRIALTCSWNTRIQVWDVIEGKEIRRFGDKYTNCISLSPDGRQVVWW
jgi:WD40 repeat protein